MNRFLARLAGTIVLLAVWEALVAAGTWPKVLLPPPSAIFAYLLRGLQDGTLVSASIVTLERLLVGYFAGLTLGLPLGLLTARVRFLSDTLGLLALGLQTLPSVCWVPLALLWFGQTEGAMLFVVFMGTVWAVLLASEAGVRNVPPIYARAARTMGAGRFSTMFLVVVPAAMPFILGGLKQGWAFAWRSLMAAEFFVTVLTGFGLGHLLHYGRELHAMDQVFGIMLVIVLVGLAADRLMFAPAERFLHRRWGTA